MLSVQEALGQYSRNQLDKEDLKSMLLVKGIHNLNLPKHGLAFSFDGISDLLFGDELKRRADEKITLLMPAFGFGRSLLDALSLHPNA